MNLNQLTKSELIEMIEKNKPVVRYKQDWHLLFKMFFVLLETWKIQASKIANWYILDWFRIDKIANKFVLYPEWGTNSKSVEVFVDTEELDFNTAFIYKHLN